MERMLAVIVDTPSASGAGRAVCCTRRLALSSATSDQVSRARRALHRGEAGRCIIEVPRPADAAAVWAIAHTLIQQQGADAPVVAARRARTLLDAGEIEGRLAWMRVMVASKALLGMEAV